MFPKTLYTPEETKQQVAARYNLMKHKTFVTILIKQQLLSICQTYPLVNV